MGGIVEYFENNPEIRVIILCSNDPSDIGMAQVLQQAITMDMMREEIGHTDPADKVITVNGQNPRYN